MTEKKLYQAYVLIEFISSGKHYDNLMKILNENGFTVKEIHSAEDSELIRIKTGLINTTRRDFPQYNKDNYIM